MVQGLRVKTPLSHYDVYETPLDYAGLDSNDTARPGHSSVNILKGGDDACQSETWWSAMNTALCV